MKQSILPNITGIFILLILLFPKTAFAATTPFRSANIITTDGYVAYTDLSYCSETDGLTCDRDLANLYGNLYFRDFGSYQDFGMPQDAKITRVKTRVTGKANTGLYIGLFYGSTLCFSPSDLWTAWNLYSSTITSQTFSTPVSSVWQPGTVSAYCLQPSLIQSSFWRVNYSSSQAWFANIDNLEVAFDYDVIATLTPTPTSTPTMTPSLTPTSTPTPTPSKTPLLIIPGIMGSELKVNEDTEWSQPNGHGGTYNNIYKKDDIVWVNQLEALKPGHDDYFDILKMKSDGLTSEANINTTGDLYDEVYGKTIRFFDDNGYTLDTDLFVFAYDWRKDISLTKSLLNQKIEEIKTQTNSDKVDILAHSMGGLVARNYIADSQKAQNVRQLYTLGTPHLGAVNFIKALMYGICLPEDFYSFCFTLAQSEIKDISQNMISGYEIAPSQKYFDFYTNNSNEYPFPFQNDSGSLNYTQIKSYLTTLGYNTALFGHAESFHNLDNDLTNTNGVDVINIVGSGFPTLGQIIEKTVLELNGLQVIKKDFLNINGDETVPLYSASISDSGRNLSLLGNAMVYYTQQNHLGLVVPGCALDSVKNTLKNNTPPPCASDKPYKYSGNFLSVYSPVNIHVYDSQNRHTGPTDSGDFEENIPGSSYETMGDDKFIWLPDDGQYQIKFEATDNGSFDFKIRKYENSENTQTVLYKDIPLTSTTKAETTFDTSSSQYPKLHIDENGDGNIDQVLPPSSTLTGEQLLDYVPPVTTIQSVGSQGSDGWYRSNVALTLKAEDNSSGILRIEYSLDGGNTVQPYTNPISVETEGITKIKYHSIDQAGNEEEPKEFEVKIDKTMPEITVQFNPSTKLLEAKGEDSGSGIESVVHTDNGIAVQDKAGNITRLDITSEKINNDKAGTQEIVVNSLKYNDQPSVIPQTTLKVEWNADTDDSLNHLVQNFEISGTEKIMTVYNENRDKSSIITKTVGQNSEKSTTLGLKIIKLVSDKGKLLLEILN